MSTGTDDATTKQDTQPLKPIVDTKRQESENDINSQILMSLSKSTSSEREDPNGNPSNAAQSDALLKAFMSSFEE